MERAGDRLLLGPSGQRAAGDRLRVGLRDELGGDGRGVAEEGQGSPGGAPHGTAIRAAYIHAHTHTYTRKN